MLALSVVGGTLTAVKILGFLGGVPPLVFVAIAWIGIVIGEEALKKFRHYREPLLGPLEAGERLLKEARDPTNSSCAKRQAEFMERIDAWVGEVPPLLDKPADHARRGEWLKVRWNYRGAPQPKDWLETKDRIIDPLIDRLAMLEKFCRERSADR